MTRRLEYNLGRYPRELLRQSPILCYFLKLISFHCFEQLLISLITIPILR